MIDLNLKKMLEDKNISISQLKKGTKLSDKTIENMLQNNLKKVSMSAVVTLIEFLDVSLDKYIKR